MTHIKRIKKKLHGSFKKSANSIKSIKKLLRALSARKSKINPGIGLGLCPSGSTKITSYNKFDEPEDHPVPMYYTDYNRFNNFLKEQATDISKGTYDKVQDIHALFKKSRSVHSYGRKRKLSRRKRTRSRK
jgi:hypothetical protein